MSELDTGAICSCMCASHRRRILTDLCDPFDPAVPSEWLARFMGLIHDTPNLIWYLLTKRPEQWRRRMTDVIELKSNVGDAVFGMVERWLGGTPPTNVRLGVSVEDQKRADERIPALLAIPAAFLWVSFEPLLGPIYVYKIADVPGWKATANMLSRINFAVIGGESCCPRNKARPCNVDWIRSLVRQCDSAGVPVHVKQLGSNPTEGATGDVETAFLRHTVTHWQGGDPYEWPADLRPYKEVPL